MDTQALRDVARDSAVPFASVVAMVAGFVLMRYAAIVESYVLLVVAFALMAAGLFTLVFRGRRSDEWVEG